MTHFTISEPLLLYTFPLEAKEQEKLDAFLLLLEKSGAVSYTPLDVYKRQVVGSPCPTRIAPRRCDLPKIGYARNRPL